MIAGRLCQSSSQATIGDSSHGRLANRGRQDHTPFAATVNGPIEVKARRGQSALVPGPVACHWCSRQNRHGKDRRNLFETRLTQALHQTGDKMRSDATCSSVPLTYSRPTVHASDLHSRTFLLGSHGWVILECLAVTIQPQPISGCQDNNCNGVHDGEEAWPSPFSGGRGVDSSGVGICRLFQLYAGHAPAWCGGGHRRE